MYGKATVELSSWGSIDDVPHLGLPEGIVALEPEFVIGVHLDGEVVTGIDELDEQGKALTKTL